MISSEHGRYIDFLRIEIHNLLDKDMQMCCFNIFILVEIRLFIQQHSISAVQY